MNVYVVLSSNIEGQTELHSIWRSYDAALLEVHRLMQERVPSYCGPECWKPHKNIDSWWFYGCDAIGIEEFEVQGKPGVEG